MITHDLNPDFIFLPHTQSIVCATVDSQSLEHYDKKLTKNIRPTDILQIYTSI